MRSRYGGKICKHCGEPVMKIRFSGHDKWWHATPNGVSPTFRHCADDHDQPVAEPL